MAVTYYVALPFVKTEEGVAPGELQEMPNEGTAIRRPVRAVSVRYCCAVRSSFLARARLLGLDAGLGDGLAPHLRADPRRC
jgi:hypothetical protein